MILGYWKCISIYKDTTPECQHARKDVNSALSITFFPYRFEVLHFFRLWRWKNGNFEIWSYVTSKSLQNQFFEYFSKNGLLKSSTENQSFAIFDHFKIFFAKNAFLRGKKCLCLSTWDGFFKNDSKKQIFESLSISPKF